MDEIVYTCAYCHKVTSKEREYALYYKDILYTTSLCGACYGLFTQSKIRRIVESYARREYNKSHEKR